MTPAAEDPNYKHAREAQTKFDHYFPVLAFTLLGLAVQTAKWGHPVATTFELEAWGLMLLAGVLSLWRLEAAPVMYIRQAKIHEEQDRLRAARIHAPLDADGRPLQALVDDADRVQRGTVFLYRVQRTALIIGLVVLMAARAVHGIDAAGARHDAGAASSMLSRF